MKNKHHTLKERKENRGFVARLLLGICFISPLLVALLFSFVPDEELYGLPTVERILETLTFDNYRWAFANIPILRYVTNSLVMCLVVIASQLILASLTAYAFSFFQFKGKDLLFTVILVAMMIPGQVVIIANFLTVRGWGLVNTYLGLCLPSLIGGKAIFMMRQSFLTLPKELKEATTIDGCSELGFLFRFAIPLSLPSLASLAMMLFIDIFNAYMWPLLVSRHTDMYTIQVGMATLVSGAEAPTYGRTLAGAVLSLIVPVGIFLIGQDYLIKGMVKGSVKG